MGQIFRYTRQSQWAIEGSTWRPPGTITLRDEAGQAIGSTVINTLTLTLYDKSGSAPDIVNGVEEVNIKNTGRGQLSSTGVLTLTLTPQDTALIDATHAYEVRGALVRYTWANETKADAIEITFYIRNLSRHPYVAP